MITLIRHNDTIDRLYDGSAQVIMMTRFIDQTFHGMDH